MKEDRGVVRAPVASMTGLGDLKEPKLFWLQSLKTKGKKGGLECEIRISE